MIKFYKLFSNNKLLLKILRLGFLYICIFFLWDFELLSVAWFRKYEEYTIRGLQVAVDLSIKSWS